MHSELMQQYGCCIFAGEVGYRCQPLYVMEIDVGLSNGDAVQDFIRAHKGVRWLEGDSLVLPDIGQEYTVVAVRPFKTGKKFYLYVDLESTCALDDCETAFVVAKEVHEWMGSRHLTRCCSAHRRMFYTPMEQAWKTKEERETLAQRAAVTAKAKTARKAARKAPEWGVSEKAVLAALDGLSVLYGAVAAPVVVSQAMAALDRPSGRDTRKQSATRALRGLIAKGVVLQTPQGTCALP